jgi:hypothetical protein
MLHRVTSHGLLVRCAIRFDVTITAEQATNFPAKSTALRTGLTWPKIRLSQAVCDQRHDSHTVTLLDTLREALAADGIPVLRRILDQPTSPRLHPGNRHDSCLTNKRWTQPP